MLTCLHVIMVSCGHDVFSLVVLSALGIGSIVLNCSGLPVQFSTFFVFSSGIGVGLNQLRRDRW